MRWCAPASAVHHGDCLEVVPELARRGKFDLAYADPPFNAGHWVPDMVIAAGWDPYYLPALWETDYSDIYQAIGEIKRAGFDVFLVLEAERGGVEARHRRLGRAQGEAQRVLGR